MRNTLKLWIALFVLTLSANIWAMDVGKYTSGGWGDPSQSGHGYSIEVMNDDLAIIYWYVYNPDGTSTFLLTVGVINGNTITGNTNYFSGMKFGEFNPATVNEDRWGTVTVTFHDCNNATLNYSSTMSHNGTPFGSGTVQLKKLVSLQGMHCTDSPLAGNYHFTSVTSIGIGLGAAVVFENGEIFYFARGESFFEVGVGALNQTGSGTFNGDGTAYELSVDSPGEDFSESGTIYDDRLEVGWGSSDETIATRMESFQHGLTMQMLAGTYSDYNYLGEMVGTTNISTTGQVDIAEFGCENFVGHVSIPNGNFNQIRFEYSSPNCGSATSAGVYDPGKDIFYTVGTTSDQAWGFFFESRRQ